MTWRQLAERREELKAQYYNAAHCGVWGEEESAKFREATEIRKQLGDAGLLDGLTWNPLWKKIDEVDRKEKEAFGGL